MDVWIWGREGGKAYRSCLLQRPQILRPIVNKISAIFRKCLNSSWLGETFPRNRDREVRARDGGSGCGFRLQDGFIPLDELDEGGGASGEG